MLPDLAWLPNAQRIRIERGRGGLAGAWVAHYDLWRRDQGFVGIAVLTNATQQMDPTGQVARRLRSTAVSLEVPNEVVQAFLQALTATATRAPLPPGTVRLSVTDDRPWWLIDVEAADSCHERRCVASRAIRFSSPPTGERPTPWFLWAADRAVEIEPAPIMQACDNLAAHLRDDVLESLWAGAPP